jgi:hypothetical protein
MDLRTNYRQDYPTPKLSPTRSAPIKTADTSNEQKVYTRRPMNGISQTTFDFRPHSYYPPRQSFDMEPFHSQISIGDSNTALTKLDFILVKFYFKDCVLSIEILNIVVIIQVLIRINIIDNNL